MPVRFWKKTSGSAHLRKQSVEANRLEGEPPVKNLTILVIVSLFAITSSGNAFPQTLFSVVSIPGVSPNSQIAINNNGQVLIDTATATAHQPSIWNRLTGGQALSLVGTNNGAT